VPTHAAGGISRRARDTMQNFAKVSYRYLPIAIQNAIVEHYGRATHRRRFGPEFERLSAFLEESEWYEPDRLRAYQEERLGLVIRHAYDTVPYYRDVMDELRLRPPDVRRVEDLRKLPVLTRNELIANRDRLRSSTVRRGLRKVSSSGTVGFPVTVWWDRAIDVVNNACTWRVRRWAGVGHGPRAATLLGKPIVPNRQKRPPFWRYNTSWNTVMFSCNHLRPDSLPLYVQTLRNERIETLHAYPSSAYILARFLEAEGDHIPLKAVFLTGEPHLPIERRVIEERFQTKAFDAYGLAERVVYTSECDRHDGHHVFSEFGITELINDAGDAVPAGGLARIVSTSLHNMAMPLIRYDVGDTGITRERSCECGRTLPMLESVTTRAEDILVLPDGRMVPPITASRAFWGIEGLRREQVVQHRPDEIIARMEIDRDITAAEEDGMRAYFLRRLGPDVRVVIERVDEIPLTATGKYRRVVSTVPLNLGAGDIPNRFADAPLIESDERLT